MQITMKTVEIPIDKIKNIINDRVFLNTEAPEEDPAMVNLIASINKRGLLHPVIVRKLNNGEYEKIAGARRTIAMRFLGYETIPAFVLPEDISDFNAYMISFDENTKRENLDAVSLIEIRLKLLAVYVYSVIGKQLEKVNFEIAKENNSLEQEGKEFFNKAKYVKKLIEETEDGYKKITPLQSKIYHAVLNFLDNIGKSFESFRKDLYALGFSTITKKLLSLKYLNMVMAKKIESYKNYDEQNYSKVLDELEKILRNVDEGEIEEEEAKDIVKQLVINIDQLLKYGTKDKAVYVERIKKRLNRTLEALIKIDDAKFNDTLTSEINNKLSEIEKKKKKI